jgi:hypothetical protein
MSETFSTHGLEPGTNGSPIGATNGTFSLENILGENHDGVQDLATREEEEDIERPVIEGYCVECEGIFLPNRSNDGRSQAFSSLPLDQPAEVLCETCSDPYCEVCFASQHRKGSRKMHIVKPLTSKKVEVSGETTVAKASANGEPVSDASTIFLFLTASEFSCR